MANVFDCAKYILETCGRMSTMKLQKLCYYCQAWSLVWDDVELFPEEFEAWANGPVCRELYNATKGKFSVTAADELGNSNNLQDYQKNSIRIVLDYYAKHNAQWLSQLTHLEEPWINARFYVPPGVSSSNVISKASMAEYYGGL
mgnify:CR=1 FL=1